MFDDWMIQLTFVFHLGIFNLEKDSFFFSLQNHFPKRNEQQRLWLPGDASVERPRSPVIRRRVGLIPLANRAVPMNLRIQWETGSHDFVAALTTDPTVPRNGVLYYRREANRPAEQIYVSFFFSFSFSSVLSRVLITIVKGKKKRKNKNAAQASSNATSLLLSWKKKRWKEWEFFFHSFFSFECQEENARILKTKKVITKCLKWRVGAVFKKFNLI